MQPLTVSQPEKHSYQLPPAMSDDQSIDTSLLEIIISTKNEQLFIGGLTGLAFQNNIDDWRISMNVVLKYPLERKHSKDALSWHFYLHHGIEQTSSPGITSATTLVSV